jgi:hypothetical protein
MKDLLGYELQECLKADLESEDAPDCDLSNEQIEAAAQAKREQREDMARAELDWFFGAMEGRVPSSRAAPAEARRPARRIARWLRRIPAFHRGALSLCFTPKAWPTWLVREYGGSTSLVVRLECSLHPSTGGQTTEELEEAALERLGKVREGDLWSRAWDHEYLALRAYLKVRGTRPCVLPATPPASAPSATTDSDARSVAAAKEVSPNGAPEGSASTAGACPPHSAADPANEAP